nr:putative RNA-dependent RNA polymerase [Poaceae Liege totivirus 15]
MKIRKYGGGGWAWDVKTGYIPRYLAVRGDDDDRAIMVPMHLADFFFVGVGPPTVGGKCSVDVCGVSMNGYTVYLGGDKSAYYCAFDNLIGGITRPAALSHTFALAEIHNYDYFEPCSELSLNPAAAVKQVKKGWDARIQASRAYGSNFGAGVPASKVTSSHHVHYTAAEVAGALDEVRVAETLIMRKLLHLGDMHQAALAGFMLWLNSLSGRLLSLVMRFDCWDAADITSLAKALKADVRRAKLMQNNYPESLLPIFEAEVLVNRGVGQVDWTQERANREFPDTAVISEDECYSEAVKILMQGKSDHGRVKHMTWDEYWKQRWQFTPTGSIKSQYKHDLEDMPGDYRLKNKFVALNTTDLTKFEDWITRAPAIHAWSSTKYEWGKERAIYGCDLTNFVLTNFCMFECEEKLPAYFPVGRRAEPRYVNKLLDGILDGHEAFCFDFEDFNSQHSTSSMRAVLRAYADVYGGQMSTQQREAMTWVIRSVDDMVVHDNIGGTGTYRAHGTLFSGWRLTTFINSVLNAVYTKKIYEPTASRHVLSSAHNGDDVIIGVNNSAQAKGMLRNSLKYRIRAQPAKCVLSGVAEFLRVDRSSDTGGQYLSRAIATLVHSRIESGVSVSLADSLRSNESRLSEYCDRQGDLDVALALRDRYLTRVARVYGNSREEAMTLLSTSSVLGGLSMSRDAGIDYTVEIKTEEEEDDERNPMRVSGTRRWRGIADMTNEVVKLMTERTSAKISREDVAKRIYDSTLNALSLNRKKVIMTENRHRDRARNWREHRGTFKHLRKNGTLGVARLAGIKIDLLAGNKEALDELLHKVAQSAEPLSFLALAT